MNLATTLDWDMTSLMTHLIIVTTARAVSALELMVSWITWITVTSGQPAALKISMLLIIAVLLKIKKHILM